MVNSDTQPEAMRDPAKAKPKQPVSPEPVLLGRQTAELWGTTGASAGASGKPTMSQEESTAPEGLAWWQDSYLARGDPGFNSHLWISGTPA